MPLPFGSSFGPKPRPVSAAVAYPMPGISHPAPPTTAIEPLATRTPALPTGVGTAAAPAPAMKPVAVAPIAAPKTGLAGARQQATNAIGSVGKTIAQNPSATLSVLQGLGGIFSYGSAKDPGKMPAPAAYAPPLRGAQGMESTSYNQARQDILAGQTVASAPASTDVAGGIVQRLLAQRQAGAGIGNLAVTNNQTYQADRGRVMDQEGRGYDTNYQQQGQYRQAKYAEDRRLYEGRRTQAGAQVQGAVDSIAAAYQARQQGKQLKLESQNRQAEAEITQLHNDLSAATTPEQRKLLLDRLKVLDPQGVRYKVASSRYGSAVALAGGGSVPSGNLKFETKKVGGASSSKTGQKSGLRSKTALPASVAVVHALSQQFGRQIDRLAAQSRAAFDRSIAAATRLRSSTPNSIGSSIRR